MPLTKRNHSHTRWTYLVGAIVIAIPVIAAFYIAGHQSEREQEQHAALLANEILQRSHELTDQMLVALTSMEVGKPAAPCSRDNIDRMVKATAESQNITAVGYIDHDRLMCSSFGNHGDGIPLGPPDFLSRLDYYVWTAAKLPGITDKPFLITMNKTSGYAAILHSGFVIPIQSDQPDFTVGVYSLSRHKVVVERGQFKPEWERLGQRNTAVFFDGNFVVALKRSDRYDYIAFAAIPAAQLQASWKYLTLILVPLGIVAGFVLALVVFRVSQYRRALPVQLRQGLRNDELFLVYQPIVELASGRWIGAEALLRWRRPNGELVSPDVFIPIAEHNHMIGEVTARLIDLFADDAAVLLHAHPDFHISLNLSASDFQNAAVADQLREAITHTHIHPANVHIEVTERMLVNGEASRRNLQAMRDMGIRIAVDDFGTGYSGLSYLTSLPLDSLKIDKAFIDTIGTDAATSEVIGHIIEIAKSLKLTMIAEGVESQAQATYLLERGVQFAQGWLFAQAMPIQQLQEGLRKQALHPA